MDCKQNTSIITQEQDSGISPNFEFSSVDPDPETKAETNADSDSQTEQCNNFKAKKDQCDNLDSQTDSTFQKDSGARKKTTKPSRGKLWPLHSTTNWEEHDYSDYDHEQCARRYGYFGHYARRYGYHGPYVRRCPLSSELFKRNSRYMYEDYT